MTANFNTQLPIAIGSDHAGFDYKTVLIDYIATLGFTTDDKGPNSDASVDYPDYAHPVAAAVEQGTATAGILICGSGNGVCITANKHQGVRAALTWNEELAALARQHNNANVLCIPARFVDIETAKAMVKTYLTTAFEGGRHENRVNKI